MRTVFLLAFILSCTYAKDWWENANFYQIYPRSFKDSDGDGIGDLKGVTEKLPYLKEIGITAAWLSPIFQSPMVDFGYDISDYYEIQPEYGTKADLLNLIKRAKEIGVKIILDFVPNHTSDKHKWFQRSVKRDGIYEDFYIWHDGLPNPNNASGRNLPPSNWNAEFRYSAWQWVEERGQYYYHQFGVQQPDLNYRNPLVVESMNNVLRYWMNLGIDGFRIDAVPYLYEIEKDKNGNYKDEPLNPDCADPDDFCKTFHIYTKDQPETYDLIYQWRAVVDQFKAEHGGETRVLLTEGYTTLEGQQLFYGNGVKNGSHVPFNFELMNMVNSSTAEDFSRTIDSWLNNMPKDVQANWVLGNHDQKRIAGRFGTNRIDLLNMMLQTLPGVAVTYNGEEIGMNDGVISWEDTVDPQACSTNPNIYVSYSRDPARTPFQWDDSINAGFSSASKTWLPVGPDYKTNNVKAQEAAPNSHLKIFKKLTAVRQNKAFADGSYQSAMVGKNILVYKREIPGEKGYVVVLNFGKTSQDIDVRGLFPKISEKAEVIVSSLQSSYKAGEIVQTNKIMAAGEIGTVFKLL